MNSNAGECAGEPLHGGDVELSVLLGSGIVVGVDVAGEEFSTKTVDERGASSDSAADCKDSRPTVAIVCGRARFPRPAATPDTEALAPPAPHAGGAATPDSRAECGFSSRPSTTNLCALCTSVVKPLTSRPTAAFGGSQCGEESAQQKLGDFRFRTAPVARPGGCPNGKQGTACWPEKQSPYCTRINQKLQRSPPPHAVVLRHLRLGDCRT